MCQQFGRVSPWWQGTGGGGGEMVIGGLCLEIRGRGVRKKLLADSLKKNWTMARGRESYAFLHISSQYNFLLYINLNNR